MVRKRWGILALAVALVTVGWIGGISSTADGSRPGAEAPSVQLAADGGGSDRAASGGAPSVFSLAGSFQVEAANSGADPADRTLDVPVPADAKGVVAELRWQGTADLDLALWSPAFCGMDANESVADAACTVAFFATGEGEGAYGTDRSQPAIQDQAAEVRVDQSTIQDESCDEDTCTWTAHINPNLAVDTSFELKVSVFPDQAPGEHYTAFGDG